MPKPRYAEVIPVMSHAVEAVLFDFDGTLVDSMPAWHQLESSLAWLAGIEYTSALAGSLNANTLEQTIAFFHYGFGVGRSCEQLLESAHGVLFERYRNDVPLRKGVRSFLETLGKNGIPLAILSSSPSDFVCTSLKRKRLDKSFSFIASAQDERASKQDPSYVARTAARFQVDPQSIWCFDDSAYALRAMQLAGLNTVGVYDSDAAGTFEELQECAGQAVRGFSQFDHGTFLRHGRIAGI